eukprot:m.33128 g.33128  ORF g.33128 m.33128 type:complete len:491 (+) comp12198_c0_seq1:30-1502(+)
MAAFIWTLCAIAALSHATPLDDYVNKPDDTYAWTDLQMTENGTGYTAHFLNMTSQTWLSSADVDRSVWWHYMVIVMPDEVKYTDTAFMYITGDYNTDSIPKTSSEDVLLCIAIATTSFAPCAVLFQIPNAPIYFTAEQPPKRRVEDAIIAYTWNHFIENPDEPEWLLRLPMTKAAVRAMDTTEAFLKKNYDYTITGHVVGGASKRGWTTWTTAAVDKRVIAQVPIVMDMLKLVPNVHHMYRAYGGWTFAFKDYYEMNFTAQLDNPNMEKLAGIVDPYSYKERYTQPKLVIDSTGDEFFQLDDNYMWWDELAQYGESHLIFIKNAEHSLATGIVEVVKTVSSFAHDICAKRARPTMSWKFGRNADNTSAWINLTTSEKPKKVTIRHADTLNHTRRDWRLVTGDNPCPTIAVDGGCIQPVLWFGEPAIQEDDTHYSGEMAFPDAGWRAWFLEVEFDAPVGIFPYIWSTQVDIIPETFPFPDCHGEGCRGILV